MTPKQIICYDVYTLSEVFTIDVATSAWSRMIVVNDNFLVFENNELKLEVYDIKYKELRAKSFEI